MQSVQVCVNAHAQKVSADNEVRAKKRQFIQDLINRTYLSDNDMINVLIQYDYSKDVAKIICEYSKYTIHLDMLWYFPPSLNPYDFEPIIPKTETKYTYYLRERISLIDKKYDLCHNQLSKKFNTYLKDSSLEYEIILYQTNKICHNYIKVYIVEKKITVQSNVISCLFNVERLDKIIRVNDLNSFSELFDKNIHDDIREHRYDYITESDEIMKEKWEIWRKIFGPAMIIINERYSHY